VKVEPGLAAAVRVTVVPGLNSPTQSGPHWIPSGELETVREHRFKTISGDVGLDLGGRSYDVRFKTMSGDLACTLAAEVTLEGRHDKHVVVGAGETRVTIKTVSGDLQLHRGGNGVPEPAVGSTDRSGADPESTVRMDQAGPAGGSDSREILERLARGELDVDAAARALDDARAAPR